MLKRETHLSKKLQEKYAKEITQSYELITHAYKEKILTNEVRLENHLKMSEV